MDQSASRISNSSLLSPDSDKMFNNGRFVRSYLSWINRARPHFKCSYLLTVLLFKYTTGCANLCPGNSSCNKKYVQSPNQENSTFLGVYQSTGLTTSSGVSLHHASNFTLTPVISHSLSDKRNYSTSLEAVGQNSSFPHHHKDLHGTNKVITMADGPFSPGDPNSFSRPELAVIEHIDLFLDVNFESKTLSGEAHYVIGRKDPNVTNVIMDVYNLTILDIQEKNTKSTLSYNIGTHVDNFGSKLDITLPPKDKDHNRVELIIKYKTSPTSSALQWLEPEQTAGKTKPYMFSQCQPIHCRSMIPVQDTPSVKQTYTATITAPKDLKVLMSALRSDEHKNYFYQPIKVPSYLVAIVVGNLASYKISERCSVWSEPELVKEAADEFNETEKFLSTAEEICGTYVWGVYDLVMLPPSFPFGGMENPCLTFVTPTLLAGDGSLAAVVAHEISHSWTGNLVTNRNFEHFWLNEGFTMFVERKITGRLRGEAERHFDALSGLKDLKQALKTLGEDNPLTKLIVDLKHTHPDDAFSTCPYEKGHTFLFYLEQLLGGPKDFEPWLKKYLAEFALQSIDTDNFKAHLTSHFAHKPEIHQIEWDLWLNTTGMPPHIPKYDTSLQDVCNDLANRWISWNHTKETPFSKQDLAAFTPGQKIEFLAILLDKEMYDLPKVKSLQEVYRFNGVRNCEIRFRWLKLCLKARWKEQVPHVIDMVTSQGRMKYVRPLYRELYAWEDTRQTAIDTFKQHRKQMMYVTAYTLAKDLKLGDLDSAEKKAESKG